MGSFPLTFHTSNPRLFCFGLGCVASSLGLALKRHGWQVSGTTRSSEARDRLARLGLNVFLFDGTGPLPKDAILGASHILSAIPPDEEGDPVLRQHRSVLEAAAKGSASWIGYLSSTGVYGDHSGRWVTEETPPAPGLTRTQIRLDAERGWLSLPNNASHVFRLAGIYGPERNALNAIQCGSAHRIVKPKQVFCRVHLDDVVQVLRASMSCPHPGTIYNVCDDEPAPPQDVICFAAQLLNVPPPPEEKLEDAALSPIARSFYASNRRVSNRRIKDDLGVRLIYPTYREGLRACFAAQPQVA